MLWWNCNVQVYFCEEDQVCLYKALAFEVPFSSELAAGQSAQIVPLSYTVKPVQVAKGFTKLQWWCGKGELCILLLCSTLLFWAEIGYFFSIRLVKWFVCSWLRPSEDQMLLIQILDTSRIVILSLLLHVWCTYTRNSRVVAICERWYRPSHIFKYDQKIYQAQNWHA